MEPYSSWVNCTKEKCISADLMHLFLVRFVTVRLTYIFIDYPDCEYIIILNTSLVIIIIWLLALVSLAKLHPFNAHIWKSPSSLNQGLPLSIICLQLTMCTFSFFCEILLHRYHIDGKHVRVYHSRICQQTSFLAMAISKYGHWRGGASQDWQAPKIIYMHYNRRIQNNDIFTIWIVNKYIC
jgi:hypothetical protein